MVRSSLAAAVLLIALGAAAQPTAKPAGLSNPAGAFDLVEGDVRILDSSRRERDARLGDVLVEGDSVVTGADAEAHVAMEDGGELGIRPNSRIRIVKYKAEGSTDDRSVISLVEGTLRSVSGWIGKFNARNYAIRTPTATIGVRGTDHETRVLPPGHGDGEAGTYDRVHAGATLITTAQGSTEVRPDQAGFVPQSGSRRPRLLDRVPEFFRPARHDRRFDGLHETLHRRIDQVRDERRHFVRDRRGEFDSRKREIHKQRESRIREFRERPGRPGVRADDRHKAREERRSRRGEARPASDRPERKGRDEERRRKFDQKARHRDASEPPRQRRDGARKRE